MSYLHAMLGGTGVGPALLGIVMLGALVLYALTGGADYGGGFWDLFATGRTRSIQRDVIETAIGPVWEANHVWLILLVTILFAGFPRAFAVITTALHIPILFLLLGIVLRGAAFTFRAHDPRGKAADRRWSIVFSIASLAAPVLLGVVVGAISSGRVRMNGWIVTGGYVWPWLATWPILIGVFTLAVFAYLAAVYLCVEASNRSHSPEGAGETPVVLAFRARAIASWCAVTVLSWVILAQATVDAPAIADGLLHRYWTWPLHAATAIASLGALASLVRERYRRARVFAAAEVAFLVVGWGASQFPSIVAPDVTLGNAAAPAATQRLLLGAIALGSVLLFPSLFLLYRSFNSDPRRRSPGAAP